VIPLPAALAGPALGAAILLAAASSAYAWLRLIHEPAIRAEYAAELAAATAEAHARLQAAALTVAEAANADQAAREARRIEIRERIVRVPVTSACADSPAVRAALGGLRARPADPGAPAGAALPAGVPGRAAAAGAGR
jgi:hypothetical protein